MMALVSKDAKYILEPQAGKGDLACIARGDKTQAELESLADREYCRYSDRDGRGSREVDCIEINPELLPVLREKGFNVVGFDWLDYAGISYYDAIVMNPPFSNGEEHLLKAWDFLHAGEIVCLLNEETINNPYTEKRQRLVSLVMKHGAVEPLGECFHDAEHQTNVRISLVYLKKEAEDDTLNLWEVKTSEKQVDTSEFGGDENMLAIRDNLGNMEHWYNMATEHMVHAFEHLRKASVYLGSNGIHVNEDYKRIIGIALDNRNSARAEFQKKHRRDAWMKVFSRMEFHKWLDKKQTEEMLRDIERDSNIPFTAVNIKATLENIFLQRRKLFEMSVANVFDSLTKFYSGNTNGGGGGGDYSGWKTNDNYKVNEKLVFPYGCRYERDFADFKTYYSHSEIDLYNDLDRVLRVLDGQSFEKCYTVARAMDQAFTRLERLRIPNHGGGKPYYKAGWSQSEQTAESEYFEVRFFQKGTVHLKWKRKDLLDQFNIAAAAGKKWLGENTQSKEAA